VLILIRGSYRYINQLDLKILGSPADRPLHWLKHQLAEVNTQFQAEAYDHIGDTDMDRFLAERAGCRCVMADPTVRQAWGPEVFPSPPKAWLAGLTMGSAMVTAKLA